jgi:hypothetical protein
MVNPARSSQGELWSWTLFFAGVTAVAFGSSYYHLNPNDATLVWDRLPVSFCWFYCIYAMDLIDPRSLYLSAVLKSTTMLIQHWCWLHDVGESRGFGKEMTERSSLWLN